MDSCITSGPSHKFYHFQTVTSSNIYYLSSVTTSHGNTASKAY
jgi:hypothetical protein